MEGFPQVIKSHHQLLQIPHHVSPSPHKRSMLHLGMRRMESLQMCVTLLGATSSVNNTLHCLRAWGPTDSSCGGTGKKKHHSSRNASTLSYGHVPSSAVGQKICRGGREVSVKKRPSSISRPGIYKLICVCTHINVFPNCQER